MTRRAGVDVLKHRLLGVSHSLSTPLETCCWPFYNNLFMKTEPQQQVKYCWGLLVHVFISTTNRTHKPATFHLTMAKSLLHGLQTEQLSWLRRWTLNEFMCTCCVWLSVEDSYSVLRSVTMLLAVSQFSNLKSKQTSSRRKLYSSSQLSDNQSLLTSKVLLNNSVFLYCV